MADMGKKQDRGQDLPGRKDSHGAGAAPVGADKPAEKIVPAGRERNFLLYTTEDGLAEVRVLIDGQTCWMPQKIMADLFETSVANINIHIRNILEDSELHEESVVKEYLITASDGKKCRTKHYNLDMILAVGYRIRSPRCGYLPSDSCTQNPARLDLRGCRFDSPAGGFRPAAFRKGVWR